MNIKKSDNLIKVSYIVSIAVIVVIIIATFVQCIAMDWLSLRPSFIRDISIDMTGLVLCGVIIFSLSQDKPWDEQNRSLFRLIFTLTTLFSMDSSLSFIEGYSSMIRENLVLNSTINFAEMLLVYCYFVYMCEEIKLDKNKFKLPGIICLSSLLVDMVLTALNMQYGFFFFINKAGEYKEGFLSKLVDVPALIVYITICILVIMTKSIKLKEKVIMSTFLVFPIIAHIFSDITGNFSAVYPAYMFSVMLIYINVFSNRSKKVLEQQIELDKQKTALMISQIQPHFLYNVLTTISNLCVTDPEEAEETTVLFSQYLRTNLDSIRNTELVPFETELRHINTYVALEKKRFKDKVIYETNCSETHFLVPPLGLQPIVENSIKHGIRGKETQGTLKLTTQKADGGYLVIIEDDGIGFDPSKPVSDDGRSHVGMNNVKSRLQHMCNATVTVESSPGNGCKTTIFFPEQNN